MSLQDTSGPPYPPSPGDFSGSNAMGSFVIGLSPIGDIRPFSVWRTIVSQYANSPTLTQMILNFQDCLDQTANIEDFFDLVINIDTAQGEGLDVWGRILAVNRVLSISGGLQWWGFVEGGTLDYSMFAPNAGTGPYYSGQKLTQNFALSDPGFRVLLLAKAFSNICDGSTKSINRLLLMLFGSSGKCYVVDGLNMTMQYKFEFRLTALQLAILTNSGVFPKPTGVSFSVVQT